MFPFIKTIIKKPLNILGLDLVRYHPRYSMGEYAYIASLNIKTVIDVGAHTGEFARMITQILPGVAVISFEPLKEEFRQLERALRNIPGARAFNIALGDRTATLEMHRSDYSQSSSLRPMAKLHQEAFPESAGETIERVEVRKLDEMEAELSLEPEILIKLDVQGYEDKVLAGASEVLSKSKAAIIEVSFRELYEGQPLFDSVYATLKEKGFTYMGNLYQLVHPVERSVLQADAFFVKF
ncbi:MAG TPA: FkbM family methyltransferase [Pyrinomonadaceae bacterium]|nr:FkbM family methyltransferase [Pyrinomonadaceae bacterium]